MFVRCIKCDKVMSSSVKSTDIQDVWDMPGGGVVFRGGTNYGSSMFDAVLDGILVKVIICDDCLKILLDRGKAQKYRVVKSNRQEIPVEEEI